MRPSFIKRDSLFEGEMNARPPVPREELVPGLPIWIHAKGYWRAGYVERTLRTRAQVWYLIGGRSVGRRKETIKQRMPSGEYHDKYCPKPRLTGEVMRTAVRHG